MTHKSVVLALVLLGGLAVGAAGLLFGKFVLSGNAFVEGLTAGLPPFRALAVALVAVPLPLFLHEAGHVVGGLVVGFRFALFAAGPVMIDRVGGRLRVRLHRHWALYGGLAATVPVDEQHLTRRLAWMVAAGPLTSAATAIAGLTSAWMMTTPSVWRVFWFTLGLSAVTNLLAVTVPGTTGGFLTDRRRFLMLWRGGPDAQRTAASALLAARNLAGVRPRDWPHPVIEQMRAAAAATLDSLTDRLAFVALHDEDTGREADALRLVQDVAAHLNVLPSVLRPTVRLELAYLHAAVHGDVAPARAELAQVPASAFVEPWQRTRVEAAIARAEGRHADAAHLAAEVMVALAGSPPCGANELVRDQMARLRGATGV